MRGQVRLGYAAYGAPGAAIDLGDEPALTIGDKSDENRAPQARAVSWRWLTGTVLTGLTSILLMGAALEAALSPNQFAARPDVVATVAPDVNGAVFGRKSDRMHPAEEKVSSRQVIQVSTVTRDGERDIIKLKPFVKISASLGAAGPDLVAKVPVYDPVKIFADAAAAGDDTSAPVATVSTSEDQLYGAAIDGEVAVKVSPFPVANPDLEPTVALAPSAVEQVVRVSADAGSDISADGGIAPLAYDDPNAGASDANAPFSALGVKIVQENVSNIAKSDASLTLDEGYQEKIIPVTQDESLRTLFQANDIKADDADEIIAALSQLIDVSRLRPGQRVRIAFATDPNAPPSQADLDADPSTDPDAAKAVEKALRPVRVSIYEDGAHQATVARADSNLFVRADEPSATPELFADLPEATVPAGPPRLYDAIYATALGQQLSEPLIDDLIRIFAYDVDFQARIGVGDTLDILNSMPDAADAASGDPEILYAALTLGGVPKRFYRFRTPDDGIVDYYDEDGKSAKKFLMRKPVAIGVIRSGFGWRVHPILGYRRLHAGVDYAAPKGTPIYAAGNGVIEKAGPSSGYGNLTVILHTNGYETAYGHQSAFAKGIVPGVHVRQGQLIGYVGSTGLSTGPHVHFEIRVNGQPVDPLRVRLPRGRELQGDFLAAFEQERQRIDTLLGNQPNTPAQKVATASLSE